MSIQDAAHVCLHLAPSISPVVTVPVGVQWDVNMLLVCIVPTTDDPEQCVCGHPFVFVVKYLFKSLVPLWLLLEELLSLALARYKLERRPEKQSPLSWPWALSESQT